jgi:hypothetical protein
MVFSRVSCQCGNWRSQAARPKIFNLSVSISGSKSLCGKKDHLVAAVLRYVTTRQLPLFFRRSLLKKPHKFFYSNIIQRLASARVIPAKTGILRIFKSSCRIKIPVFAGMTQARVFS